MELLKPEDVASADHIKAGLYADNGVGKTTLVSTSEVPTLVVTTGTEPGIKVITKTRKKNFRVVVLRKWADLGDVYDFVRRGLDDPKVKSGEKSFFRLIAFDTWTRIQFLAQMQITGTEIVKPGDELKYLMTAPKLPKGYEAWQQIGALSSTWMRNFNSLPIDVCYLFQEMTKHPQHENDILETAPALTPTALVTAKETLELLGRLYVADVEDEGDGLDKTPSELRAIDPNRRRERRLLIGKHERYFAKGPEDLLGYVMKNPTWPQISQAMLTGTPIENVK